MKLVVLQDSLLILQLNNVIGLQTSMDANNQSNFFTWCVKFILSHHKHISLPILSIIFISIITRAKYI